MLSRCSAPEHKQSRTCGWATDLVQHQQTLLRLYTCSSGESRHGGDKIGSLRQIGAGEPDRSSCSNTNRALNWSSSFRVASTTTTTAPRRAAVRPRVRRMRSARRRPHPRRPRPRSQTRSSPCPASCCGGVGPRVSQGCAAGRVGLARTAGASWSGAGCPACRRMPAEPTRAEGVVGRGRMWARRGTSCTLPVVRTPSVSRLVVCAFDVAMETFCPTSALSSVDCGQQRAPPQSRDQRATA